jgi:hypothetical protein
MYRFLSRLFQMISDRVCRSFFPANVVTRIIWQQCWLFVVVVPLVSQVRLSRPRLCVCMWQERRSFSHISHKEVISKGPDRNKKRRKKSWQGMKSGFPYLFKRPVSTHTKRDSHSDYRRETVSSFFFFFLRESFVFGGRGRSYRPLFSEWRLTTGSVVIDIQSIEENKIEMDDRPYVWISTCNCH